MPRKTDQSDVPQEGAAMTEDEATAELARLGQVLIATAGDKQKQKAASDELVALLARLTPKDFPNLAENPVVLQFMEQVAQQRAEGSDDPPGTIYNRGSVAVHSKPWRFTDLKSPPPEWRPGQPLPPGHCEWVWDYVPQKTTTATWNGLTVQFFAEQPWSGPKCFVDVLQESRRLERVAHEHAAYMFKNGGVPSDPGVINQGTRNVRAHSSAGGPGTGFMPGAGVGPSFFAGQAEDAGGEDGDGAEGEAA